MSATNYHRLRSARAAFKTGLLTSTILTGVLTGASVRAQDQPEAGNGALEEIVVTAQKRSENLQSVPISIQAFSGKLLEERNATEFEDYVKFLPSVVYQTIAPSQTSIYMRGISAVGPQEGNHSGPLPTVGVYLDEQPITTILGQLDIHLYDIQRIEALAGPQGTLFGASSESGTLRIITNKPDPSKYSGSYDVQLDTTHGDIGNIVEAYVNVPLADKVAIRLVGYEEGDPGYIDNVHGTLAYDNETTPPQDNAALVKNNFNGVQTYGGRAALGIQLDDDWTISPTAMGQDQRSTGIFGFNPRIGDLKDERFRPDRNHDRWGQAALTIQGKIGDFDVLYTTGYFDRSLQSQSDYSDYTSAYSASYANFPSYFVNAQGQPVDPTQFVVGRDHFTKQTHEFRVSSPSDDRFRFVAGLFYERQTHKIEQNYEIPGLAPALSVTGWPGTYWLTQELRVDRDYAAFGQATYDLTDQISIIGGVRVFEARNTLYGFFGYGEGVDLGFDPTQSPPLPSGEDNCFQHGGFDGANCVNLNKTVQEVNATYKASIQYKIDPDKLVYATASSGFRPGGVNRYGSLPPYTSDMLYNYEIGWKTTWDSGQLRWNGALFWENWDGFQFAFLGPSSLTQVANAGSATVRGLESDLTWAVTPNLTLSGSASFIDSELDQQFCKYLPGSGGTCPPYDAPAGAQLPVTPAVKANATARYEFDISDNMTGFLQQSVVFNGRAKSDLLAGVASEVGPLRPYESFDFSAGVTRDNMTATFFIKNMFDSRGEIARYASCAACYTNPAGAINIYVVPITPITFGVKFGQKF
jgi:outer membrane receptor protein involved in Fe transport